MARKPVDDPDHVSMSLADHLEDLRWRLIYSLIGVGIASTVTFYYGQELVVWLCQPLFEAERQVGLPRQTINLSIAGGFIVYMKVSLIAGLALAAPWVIYQLWKFVAPGLYASERRVLVMVGPLSLAMSALGVLFLYYVFMPAAITFLLLFSASYPAASSDSESPPSLRIVTHWMHEINSYFVPNGRKTLEESQGVTTQPAGTQPAMTIPELDHDPESPVEGQMWFNRTQGDLRVKLGGIVRNLQVSTPSVMVSLIDINQYLSFVMLLGFIIIIAFQLPVVMVVIGAAGVVDAAQLGRWRRYIVFGCFIVGIVATPNQDIISNVLFPILLWGLFELGLILMRLVASPRGEESTD